MTQRVRPLSHLKVVPSWGDARLGALLEVRATATAQVLVGMRCELRHHGMPVSSVLLLDGNDRGLLLERGAVAQTALDVSDIYEIAVLEPSPPIELLAQHNDLYGLVCEAEPGSGLFFVRAKLQSGHRAYVWLRDVDQNIPAGTIITDKPPNPFVIGLSTIVEQTPHEN
jgi:hypothetical protein